MDPNVTLKELRTLTKQTIHLSENPEVGVEHDLVGLSMELAERFEALDTWIRRGGFLPADWNQRAPRVRAETL
jgi:hypothetical protein